ncbi:MAG: hypothetical protein AAF657_28085 [Acidobacteriota bacterium]
MASLITLLFQGEVTTAGPLGDEEAREVAHAAFPLSPPRDATGRVDFRAWKIAPLTSGRTLISTILNRGDVDEYDRPVLRAIGCLLEQREMQGPLRDLTAVWQALEGCRPESGDLAAELGGLESRAAEQSIHSSPEAYALFRVELERSGDFHSRVAAALIEETTELYLGDLSRGLDLLRPALGLLPLERLHQLHMAIGTELSDYREPVLGLAGVAPDSWHRVGVLSRLLGRSKDLQSAAAVDFESGKAFGFSSNGPRALTQAIADPLPWPGGRQERERYRILLQCLDGSDEGNRPSPFEVVPELEDMRQAVQRLEKLSTDLAKWP